LQLWLLQIVVYDRLADIIVIEALLIMGASSGVASASILVMVYGGTVSPDRPLRVWSFSWL
jgi:hypothetical protein